MSRVLKNIIRFIFFILVQVFVLNQVPPLHHLATPYLYYLFILWLPFQMGRRMLMLCAFILGLTLDYFTSTPGLHAASCVLIAYIRPFLINLLIPQEGADTNYNEPSIKSMGFAPYFTYIAFLTLMHHSFLFLLEAMQFGGILYFILKTILCTAISLLLILIVELIFIRKQRFRTNTV